MIAIIQSALVRVLEATGLGETNLKVLVCTLLSFPFSVIFKRLPDKNYLLKNWYNVLVTAFYTFGILNLKSGFVTLFISSMGCYLITRYVRTRLMPWINFVFLMGHLATSHLNTQFFQVYDPSKIDITGAQMVLVIKLTSFGWNVHDGRQNPESLSPYLRYRAITKHPNLLPYIGYVFFYATLLTGPAFHYAEYDKFIHSSLFDDVPQEKRPGKRSRRIPRSGTPALIRTLQGFVWGALFFVSPRFVSLEYVLSGQLAAEHGFFYRIFYFWALGFSERLKYYTAWYIAEGACILCGIGYNGYNPETDTFKWDRVQNIDPYSFEMGQNAHACLESWNINTNLWLKNYVYLRVAKPGKKPGLKSTFFTFLTSAFWHGTRPGYYMAFVTGAIIQTVGKIYRRNLRPMFLEADGKTPKPSKKIYDFVCWICTQLAFGFIVQPFVILGFSESLYTWSTCYFYVHIISVLTIFLFQGPFRKPVIQWCMSHHAKVQQEKRDRKLSPEEARRVANAVETIIEKESREDKNQEFEPPLFGMPTIEDLEAIDAQELEEHIQEMSCAWTSFKKRRGLFLGENLEGLRDAYTNFTDEIQEIFQHKVVEQQKRTKGD